MTSKIIKTVLLNAFPAGGKSEIRKLLNVDKGLSKSLMLGEQIQLDDYPYVKFMRDIDDVLCSLGEQRMFYELPDRGFLTCWEWGTITVLVSEDYDDLVAQAKKPTVKSCSRWLFERIDKAREKVGIKKFLGDLCARVMWALEDQMEASAREFFDSKYASIPETLEGKTVFIEFSRGGPDSASFPLAAPNGYQYTYSLLSDKILEGASILYVWITAEMSRAKNIARGQESVNGPVMGTAEAAKYVLSLNHTVPSWVMFNSYGCDDFEFLLSQSDRPATIKVSKPSGKSYYLPVARFDNRKDYTSFCRGNPEQWKPEDRVAIKEQLAKAFAELVEQYNRIHQ